MSLGSITNEQRNAATYAATGLAGSSFLGYCHGRYLAHKILNTPRTLWPKDAPFLQNKAINALSVSTRRGILVGVITNLALAIYHKGTLWGK